MKFHHEHGPIAKIIEIFRSVVPVCYKVHLLSYSPNDIHVFAKYSKAKPLPIPEGLPIRDGLTIIKNGSSGNVMKVSSDARDCLFSMKLPSGNTVYFGTFLVLSVDYEDYLTATISYIFAMTDDDAVEFTKEYYAYKHDPKRNENGVIMDQDGRELDGFKRMDWKNVFLAKGVVDNIRSEINYFFNNRKFYKERNIDWRRGMILAGPPGNGKTSICRAIASESRVPVIYASLGDDEILRVLKSTQDTIARNAPCIVIFEDADALGETEHSRSTVLNMLDGFFTFDGCFFIASTNAPEKLDQAFTGRPSRFDSYYIIGYPNESTRESILKYRLGKDYCKIKKADMSAFIKSLHDLSVASIQEIAIAAIKQSINTQSNLTIDMLYSSLKKMKTHLKFSKAGFKAWEKDTMGF